MWIEMMAPHTWPASIFPVLVALGAAYATHGVSWPSLMPWALLAICVLMQGSVNTLNDYYDYVKGADSAEDNVDPTDAVLVYNNVNPRSALALAIVLLVIAFGIGAYVIAFAGWVPLVIGVIGALFVVLYSAGKTPISYLPLGEAVSGFVMGGLIPLACYHALTLDLTPLALVWAIPEILGIGLIMLTNNTCDIEKDLEVNRKTLPVLLGRARSVKLYHAIMLVWVAAIVVNVCVFFPRGVVVLPFLLLASYPPMNALFKNPIAPQSRIGAMAQVGGLNVILGSLYAAALFASGVA